MNAKYVPSKKTLVRTIVAIVIVWLVACAAIYRTMQQPPERFASVMAKLPGPVPFIVLPFETLWLRARAGTLHKGDAAPDFTLAKLDKSGQVQLSTLTAQGKPVVLIFGSYT